MSTSKMTIASALKYAVYLQERGETMKGKIRQIEGLRTTTRIVSQTTTGPTVEEQTEFTISPAQLMSEYDANAKELRLVREVIEQANHTTELDIIAKF